MVSPVDFKAHHFFPKIKQLQFNVKKPLAVPANMSAEYGEIEVRDLYQFTFPSSHFPGRVHDIFIQEKDNPNVLNNRIIDKLGGKTYSLFDYNYGERKITFSKFMEGQYKIIWLDFSKLRMDKEHWVELQLNDDLMYKSKSLLQGFSKPFADATAPQNILNSDGKSFQGAYKCYLEIDTLPLYGMVCYSDQLNSFLYRTSVQIPNPIDTFQYRIYNSLGQESVPYCAKIYLN